jgi:hypothetical protein
MNNEYIHTSLTRITDFREKSFSTILVAKSNWKTGDYVLVRAIDNAKGWLKAESDNGRMIDLMQGDLLIGALGERYATLEATGTWKKVKSDGKMHFLTGAGLLGKLTSKSFVIPSLIGVQYIGHISRKGKALNMLDFVPNPKKIEFNIPIVLFVGTSMSAGKTTAARIVTRLLKNQGLKVVGAKLTGAGRYRDILVVKDAGAEQVFDFVDVGLPSSICDPEQYIIALRKLLSMIAASQADVAVIEIGASPLEPYNGDIAIEAIRKHVKCTILSASDPYAVYGVMKSFNLKPSIVSGPATNTLGGIDLIHNLCKVKALNIIDTKTLPELEHILKNKLQLNTEKTQIHDLK